MVGIASLFLVERAYECYNNWIRREVLMIGKILRRNFWQIWGSSTVGYGGRICQDETRGRCG